MRQIFLSLCLVAFGALEFTATAQADEDISYVRDAFSFFADPADDLEIAKARAAKEGKHILLDVGGDWCPWCEMFDTFIQTDLPSKEAFACSFVIVKVNVSQENRNVYFLRDYPNISGYPHLFVLNQDGDLRESVNTGTLEEGERYNSKAMSDFGNKYCENATSYF
jgi:thiol:disulfide interchange protein